MKKKTVVLYYSPSEDKFYNKKCKDKDELELFRNYLFRSKELEEVGAFEITLVNVDSSTYVYDVIQLKGVNT